MAHTAFSPTTSRGRGRPREFDLDAALDKSVRVFRERGYHATSIADLTEAMKLASGSVYKAFKDKRAVFLAAFDREATNPVPAARDAGDWKDRTEAHGNAGGGQCRDEAPQLKFFFD